MSTALTVENKLTAVNQLRELLAKIDGAPGRIPIGTKEPERAATFVTEADIAWAQAAKASAEAQLEAAKRDIDDYAMQFFLHASDNPERRKLHLQASKASEAWQIASEALKGATRNLGMLRGARKLSTQMHQQAAAA